MTLIKSISGIRGTIGGKPGNGLTPLDIVKFTAAYGSWIKNNSTVEKVKIVVGRDARISGEMVRNICIGTLQSLGIDVVDLDLSTTPTVEIAVPMENAQGGIILTASHNPKEWNALKLLNEKGEFISAQDGADVLEIAENESFSFVDVDDIGKCTLDETYLEKHINAILKLELVNPQLIEMSNFKIVCDSVNSTGGIFVPAMLRALGVKDITSLYGEPTGHFPHNPEPLPENLTAIAEKIKETGADLGIVVDPDVDRLVLITDKGEPFVEENTITQVTKFILSKQPGDVVVNLSTTRAVDDVAAEFGGTVYRSPVGEANVVKKMKEISAVIGGEGSGGVIYPEIHYGRDALVGIALTQQLLLIFLL